MGNTPVYRYMFLLALGGLLLLSGIVGLVRGEMQIGMGGRGRFRTTIAGLALYVVAPLQALIGFGLLVVAAVDYFDILDIGDIGFFVALLGAVCAAAALNFLGMIIGLASHADNIREQVRSTVEAAQKTPDDWG